MFIMGLIRSFNNAGYGISRNSRKKITNCPVHIMTYEQFNNLMMAAECPVVLIEGTRKLPQKDTAVLTAFAKWLAEAFPHAIFRTGNADGSDSAFARGVAEIDASRIEYILPYAGHRKKAIAQASRQISMTDMPHVVENLAVYHTKQASPKYGSLMARRATVPQLQAKSRYILRDTLKVIGAKQSSLDPASVGIFYVNKIDPVNGGTGHTIRVCQKFGVPVVIQDEWMKWPNGLHN